MVLASTERLGDSALENERSLGIIGLLCSNVLDSFFPVCPQKVEAQTVLFLIHAVRQFGAQSGPLRRVHQAFEYGKLNTLPPVLAVLRYLPQTFFSGGILRADIVTD